MHLDLKTTVKVVNSYRVPTWQSINQSWRQLWLYSDYYTLYMHNYYCSYIKLLQIMVLIRPLLHVRNLWPPWDGLIWICTSSTGLELREGREKTHRMLFWERKAGEHWSSYTVKVDQMCILKHLKLIFVYNVICIRESEGNRSVQLYSETLGRITNMCHN